MKNTILAAFYRDLITAKRFSYIYISSFMLTLLFPFALLYVPNLAMGMSIEDVTKRLSSVIEVPFATPQEAVALLILISTLISTIIVALWSAIDVLMDDMWLKTIDDVLIETRLYRYLYAFLLAMAIIDVPLSYIPSAVVAMLIMNFDLNFVITSVMILPALIISALSIGLFSITLSSLVFKIKEPWIVLNNLIPLLIVGSGIYFSIKLVPLVLALISSLTPVPHATYLLKMILVFKGITEKGVLIPFVVVTLAYLALSRLSIKRYETGVRKYGTEIRI